MKRSHAMIFLISLYLSSTRAKKTEVGGKSATSNPQTMLKENKERTPSDDELLERLLLKPKPRIPHVSSHNSVELLDISLPVGASVPNHESDEGVRGVYRKSKQKKKENIKTLSSLKRNYWPKELPHTGSMTPYRFLLDTIPDDLEYFKEPEKRSEKSRYKDCFPVRVWTLSRHGIRYPSKETTHGMRTRLLNLQESMLLKLYENGKFDKKDDFDMNIFIELLEKWVLVDELKEGVVNVSNEVLNKKKSKKEAAKELKTLSLEEQWARAKKRKGAEEKIEAAKNLTDKGIEEVFAFGKRFTQRFKNIMEKITPESLLFKFTDCQRTRVSATQFYKATGLHGNPEDPDWKPPPNWHAPVETGNEGKDPLLKYDALCGHWKRNYKKSDLNVHQLDAFVNGKEITKAIEGITGIFRTFEKSITFSDGKMFYESCAFELAWGLNSPWCMILTTKYQAVFEYLEDFEFFKNDGPDNWVNKKLGCFLFKDMVARLIGDVRKDEEGKIIAIIDEDTIDPSKATDEEPSQIKEKTDDTDPIEKKTGEIVPSKSTVEETDQIEEETEESDPTEKKSSKTESNKEKTVKKATFYFTHLTSILKFITHFALNVEDRDTLRADNYHHMGKRKWRTARIGTFTTNIIATLMKCGDSYYVSVLHQERPIVLSKCREELCPLDVFLEAYQDSIFDCNYDEICQKYKNPLFNQSFQTIRNFLPKEKTRSSSTEKRPHVQRL